MRGWRLAFAGALGLALLEVAVSNDQAAKRAGGMLTAISGVIRRILSPTVAAIPDRRKHGGAAPPPVTRQSDPGSMVPPDWTTSPTPPGYV